jgi:hypothetical protein
MRIPQRGRGSKGASEPELVAASVELDAHGTASLSIAGANPFFSAARIADDAYVWT